MKRRSFMTMTGVAGLASVTGGRMPKVARAAEAREVYELRAYHLDTPEQKTRLAEFMARAAVPAFNRIGIEPVGVFEPAKGISPVYVLLPHPSMESVATATARLLADTTFTRDGAEFLDTPADNALYTSVESSLLVAFTGMPRVERPSSTAERVFQLRIYESPSVKAGQKKIEMFNKGEIDIFRKVGLNPVFFGEALTGAKLPNLTYMVAFDNEQEQKAAWKRFGGDPDWKKISAIPEYANKKIIRGITNIVLRPLPASQI